MEKRALFHKLLLYSIFLKISMPEGGDLPPQKKVFFLLERLWYYGKKNFFAKASEVWVWNPKKNPKK